MKAYVIAGCFGNFRCTVLRAPDTDYDLPETDKPAELAVSILRDFLGVEGRLIGTPRMTDDQRVCLFMLRRAMPILPGCPAVTIRSEQIESWLRSPEKEPCETCGARTDVEYMPDPYVEEVFGEKEWGWICRTCAYERACDV
jgi:hypothetical protein